ncbi:serine protease [Myxococcus sp. AS-1-15]|uniref:trypsin-like serine peptidase n=1 Tax=Myxococcus sp. AS-1-15 TaxID=2874600 RepID=UPI001CBC4E30|nr:trypsin-like peptidase domain-containing protein [Myxococcus sp. AS-1-15]MBZ4397799.1 serine protease [Myxococcus sp. AS-1-15]
MAISDVVAKLLYTAVLTVVCLGLVTLFVSEMQRVWVDKRLYIGRFDFFETGEAKATEAKAFARQIAYHHQSFKHLLHVEHQRRESANQSETPAGTIAPLPDSTFWNGNLDALLSSANDLSSVELTVQGINIKELLSWLRDRVSTPNELTGVVEKHPNGIRALASWTRGPLRSEGSHVDGQVLDIAGQPDVDKAAFHVACGLIWAQLAGGDKALSKVPRAEFCAWAEAWSQYLDLRDRSATLLGLSAENLESVKKLRAFLDRQVAGSTRLAEVYLLRADLLDLLPAEQKTQEDLIQAQNDRLQYVMMARQPTEPEKAGVALTARSAPPDKNEVLAQVRPALRMQGDRVSDPLPENWQQHLKSGQDSGFPVSRATGSLFITKPDGKTTYLTAFAVAPRVIMTVGDHVPPLMLDHPEPQPLTGETWRFTFDDDGNSPKQTHRVTHVIFARHDTSSTAPRTIALLELAEHDTQRHPPVTLEWNPESVKSHVDQYVYVIGYPSEGSNLPKNFLRPLLGDLYDIRRLMPGRVVSLTPSQEPRPSVVRALRSDVSTTVGVAGAPLVDLRDDKVVVGLHFAGEWKENQGKFALALSMADLLATLPEFAIQRIKPGTIQDAPPMVTPLGDSSQSQ